MLSLLECKFKHNRKKPWFLEENKYHSLLRQQRNNHTGKCFFPFILSTCYFSSAANPENPPIQGAMASSLHFWRTNEGKYQLQQAQSQHVSVSLQGLHLYFLPSKRPCDGWGSSEELDWLPCTPPPILHPTARTDRPAWGRGAKHRPVWEHLSWVSTSNQRRAPRRCHLNAGRRRGWIWYILSHNPSSWCAADAAGLPWEVAHRSPVPADAATPGVRCRVAHRSTGAGGASFCPFSAISHTRRLPRAQPRGWKTSHPGHSLPGREEPSESQRRLWGHWSVPAAEGAAVPDAACPRWLCRWLSSAERKHVAGETGLYLYYIPYVHLVCLITFKTAEIAEHHIHFKAE